MNKYQNALRKISRSIGDHNWFNEYQINLLKELVDKETPMKPIYLGGNKYSCKNCSMAFELSSKVRFVNNQYCDVCGQKIDWSDEE